MTPSELLVFDDQSQDGTVAFAEDMAKRASFPIRCMVNEEGLGSVRNFERAIGACAGDVIALSDQGDLWVRHKLETVQAAFKADRVLGALFSDAAAFDEQLRPLGYCMFDFVRLDEDDRARIERGDVHDIVLEKPLVMGAALAFRRVLKALHHPRSAESAYMIHAIGSPGEPPRSSSSAVPGKSSSSTCNLGAISSAPGSPARA